MSGNSRRTGKAEGTRALAALVGMSPPTAAGGTIPREWLATLVIKVFGPDAAAHEGGKRQLLKRAILLSGGEWEDGFVSDMGSTISGEAVWHLHDRLQALGASPDTLPISSSVPLPLPLIPTNGGMLPPVHPGDTAGTRETPLNSIEEADELEISGIATYLSELSQDGTLPSGVGPPSTLPPFAPEDVDFASNDWLHRTVAVQAWLALDAPLDQPSPRELAVALMQEVSPDPADSCLRFEGDVVLLTALGSQHLETYLSRAVANREAFLEALEDDRSLKEVSEEWGLLWEESRTRARQPAAIKAAVSTWTIRHLSDHAREDKLELNPSYQRDTVWSVSDSQLLIDSILRGIPLPSIILTKSEDDGKNDDPDRLQIVDGKQRLTAILRFIGRHPTARRFVTSKGGAEEFDGSFRKFMRRHHLKSKDISENCLPFKLRIYPEGHPLRALSGKYYTDISNEKIQIGGGHTTIATLFDSITSKYHIPVIIYEQTRLQDIHDVFSLYNKQGKKLNAEELRNASFHHLALTRLMLVLSGDRPDHESLAPYLPPDVKAGLGEVGEALRDRGFGTLRFKRTKVLSWTCSILLHKPGRAGGPLVTPSTASQIDSMLNEIAGHEHEHPMAKAPKLILLARDIKAAVNAHADAENAWHPKFRNKKGIASRWEELPLVASLLASIVLVAAGEVDRLVDGETPLRKYTESMPGPSKTQNKTQWEYIARIVTGTLATVEADEATIGAALEARYGYNCLKTLKQLAGGA